MKNYRISSRFVTGVVVIGIGLFLLLANLDLIEFDLSIGKFWPMILIVIGIVKLINYDESTFTGLILLILGVYFQLSILDVEFIRNISLGSIIWPAIIILIGFSLLLDSDKPKIESYHNYNTRTQNKSDNQRSNGQREYNDIDDEYEDIDLD